MARPADLLPAGLKLHQSGDLAGAEQAYRQVLKLEPNHPDAWHLLGVIAHQLGRGDTAIEFISRALTTQPGNPVFLTNLGAAYQAMGRPLDAVESYRKALKANPGYADAHYNLGVAMEASGDPAAAAAAYREAVRLKPDHAEAYNNLGNALKAQKDFDAAAECYRRSLKARPNFALTHFNFGQLEMDRDRIDDAIACFRRAIHAQPDYADAHRQLARCSRIKKNDRESLHSFQQAVRIQPDDVDSHHEMGLLHLAANQPEQALSCFEQALRVRPDFAPAMVHQAAAWVLLKNGVAALEAADRAVAIDPKRHEAHNNRGAALQLLGRLEESQAAFETAVELKPDYAEAWNNLGTVCRFRGHGSAARTAFERAASVGSGNVDPLLHLARLAAEDRDFVTAERRLREALLQRPELIAPLLELGTALREQGRYTEAVECFERAIRLDSQNADAHCGLGIAWQVQGRLDEARKAYETSLSLNSTHSHALNNLGSVLAQQGRLDEALDAFRRLTAVRSDYFDAFANIASIEANRGRIPEAESAFQAAFNLRDDLPLKLLRISSLPPIYSSARELADWRERFDERLTELERHGMRAAESQLLPNNFYLAYQGRNDRDLQQRYANICLSSAARDGKLESEYQPAEKRGDSRIRLGVCSAFFREHTIGRLYRGLLKSLDRSRFHVTLVSINDHNDEVAREMRAASDDVIVLSDYDVPVARRRLGAAGLDLLLYTDLGMDRLSWTLAASRFAAVQCSTWGHPVTSGLKSIDYFLSSRLIEPSDAADHYTERLIRFDRLPCVYPRPRHAKPWTPARQLKLPEDRTTYVCPQSLFKIHPEFDSVLGEILRRDSRGVVIFLEGIRPLWTTQLKDRLSRACSDVFDRIVFLPLQPHHDFLSLLHHADVLLDPLHFGGGNSAYETLALGQPIVSMPSGFMRGRMVHAAYQQMGVAGPIAANTDEYVSLAVDLGRNRELRQTLTAEITERSGRLFDDAGFARDFEAFVESAVHASRTGTLVESQPPAPVFASILKDSAAKSIVVPGVPAPDVSPVTTHTRDRVRPDDVAPAPVVSPVTTSPGPVSPPGPMEESEDESSDTIPVTIGRNTARESTVRPHSDMVRPYSDMVRPHSDMVRPHSDHDEPVVVPRRRLASVLRVGTCPACGHHVSVPFFDGGNQPLTTLAWPKSATEARSMPRLPHQFLRCVDCGHVYNRDFDYANVPYSEKPNLMFNAGAMWQVHLRRVRDLILDRLPSRPVVAEVGCGSGHLLRALAEQRPGRYVGFDPSGAIDSSGGLIEARAELFDPGVHVGELRPHVIISRHVMEHLMNPLGFVQSLAFAASWENVESRLFIEVPCIDGVFTSGRTVDFFYEHNSHFTTSSLERMLLRCANHVELVARGYNDEVVFGFAMFRRRADQVLFASDALRFHDHAVRARASIRHDIDTLARCGKTVAVWGGTGKAAAFINQNGLDAERFPLVVDSDLDKVGTFVPGAGQEIRYRDWLLEHPCSVILIATQWRARDIALEIQRTGIRCEALLLEHAGRLVDYWHDEHPYRDSAAA